MKKINSNDTPPPCCFSCLRFIAKYAWALPGVSTSCDHDYCMHHKGVINPYRHDTCPFHSDTTPMTDQETGDLRDLREFIERREKREAELKKLPTETKKKKALSTMAMQLAMAAYGEGGHETNVR